MFFKRGRGWTIEKHGQKCKLLRKWLENKNDFSLNCVPDQLCQKFYNIGPKRYSLVMSCA